MYPFNVGLSQPSCDFPQNVRITSIGVIEANGVDKNNGLPIDFSTVSIKLIGDFGN
jgi:hypothetical protein